EKGPERSRERQAQNRQSADQVTEGHKFLRGKMTVGVLVAEEHADNRRDGEGVENPGLFARRESQAGQISVDQRQPATPNEELEDHHEEQAGANRSIHRLLDSG